MGGWQDRRIARERAAEKKVNEIMEQALRRYHTDPAYQREHGSCRTPCGKCRHEQEQRA